VRKAEVDYRGAQNLAPSRPPLHDLVCFCCQQAAEKYLKAVLNEQGLTIPRSHNLEDLLSFLLPFHLELGEHRRGLKFLIQFAVEVRYPGFHTTKRQATSALRWAATYAQPVALFSASAHPESVTADLRNCIHWPITLDQPYFVHSSHGLERRHRPFFTFSFKSSLLRVVLGWLAAPV
jgi:HEPN domain-containing protein